MRGKYFQAIATQRTNSVPILDFQMKRQRQIYGYFDVIQSSSKNPKHMLGEIGKK
jgi:hypothetical protein